MRWRDMGKIPLVAVRSFDNNNAPRSSNFFLVGRFGKPVVFLLREKEPKNGGSVPISCHHHHHNEI